MSSEPPARFFVNTGLVSSPGDMYNLLRPLLKQTVTYRYLRAGSIIARGTGWVERVVVDRPAVSSFFTPISICLNVDSFEHLEFETRPDQLVVYTLVQGDERVVVEYAAVADRSSAAPEQQPLPFGHGDYVQMELGPLPDEGSGATGSDGSVRFGVEPPRGDAGGE